MCNVDSVIIGKQQFVGPVGNNVVQCGLVNKAVFSVVTVHGRVPGLNGP